MPKCMRCMQDYGAEEYCPFCGAPGDLEASDRGQIPVETILNRRFIVGDVISRDRIGFTYVAWDALLERKVAIKEWLPVMLAERTQDRKTVEYSMSSDLWRELNREFLEHARRLHKAQNIPVIVPVYTFFEENNTSYYVMEYINGQTIGNILQKENPLDAKKAGEIMGKVYQALDVLHKSGFVQGNLTPDNIFICDNGTVKFLNTAWTGKGMEEIKYTVFLGKYAPPHYYSKGVQQDEEMDRYGAAAVYYRLLTGEVPTGASLRKKDKKKLPSISDYGIEVSGKTEKEILQILDCSGKRGLSALRIFQALNVLLLVTVIVLGIFIII